MKAMIFAAGRGTRLRPLTNNIPKALVEVGGRTMLEIVADKLVNRGVNTLVINIHHHSDLSRAFIEKLNYPGTKIIISDESTELLDTGGGLLKAREWLAGDQPFFVYNVDVLSDIDLDQMLNAHRASGSLATLAVADRRTSRYLLLDSQNLLSGWLNTSTGEKIICRNDTGILRQMAFSGIHIIDPEIFNYIDNNGCFPILPEYLRIASHHSISCFVHKPDLWADIGTMEKLQAARQLFKQNPRAFQ
jgi:N-acetyl-alpha-D-muramate 1-phosphate uridylyltransferase